MTMADRREAHLSSLEDMDNPERQRYFGVIDQLRGFGINQELPLPQIVVVGDQSSGKSSLLEGLTGLSFPIASELCTRFATQIVLQRTTGEQSLVKVSIVPGHSSLDDEVQKKRLLEFELQMEAEELSGSKFAWLLDEAAEYMGLPNSDAEDIENLTKRFSDDILRIEISGPDQHHLSVVDVPGLFHNPTKYQTREDLPIIRGLIETYTKDERTIILAVMDARNNLANQEVFKMAKAADPKGNRTVGIITKCDALQSGDEQGVLKIAQNEVDYLRHGWFVVRNRSTKEIQDGVTISQRHENERQFFQKSPWCNLPRDRIGIKALKPFLGQLLYEHIRREFPALVKEVEALYKATQRKLEALGASRQSATEQRQYLTRLANKYQRNVEDALRGDYGVDLDVQSKLKLRMHLRNLADQFEEDIRSHGHTRPFENIHGLVDQAYAGEDEPSDTDMTGIMQWLRASYKDARGSELPGTINPALLTNLFRQQTVNWESIANGYLDQAIKLINEYTILECERCEIDETIRRSLYVIIHRRLAAARDSAKNRLADLLNDERRGILQTVNHYYAETLEKIRRDRFIHRMSQSGLQDGLLNVNLAELTKTLYLSNEDQAVNDIHDVLKSYYKVAIKRFEDYMVVSVVERMLGDDGVLKFFSSDYVGRLSDDELAQMAAESYDTASARIELQSRCGRFKEALQVAQSV